MTTTGVERAAKRLAAKRAANLKIPDTGIITRQQRRDAARQAAKGNLELKVHGRHNGTTDIHVKY